MFKIALLIYHEVSKSPKISGVSAKFKITVLFVFMSLPDVLMKLKMTATMLSSYLDKPYAYYYST